MIALRAFARREVFLPDRADTARMILLPAHLILINTAAEPGCNVDRLFTSMGQVRAFLGSGWLF